MCIRDSEVRLQDLDPSVGDFDAAWATHALYAIPADQLDAGMARMVAALRPGGFGAVVHAASASHYLRFAELFRASFAPDSTPFCSAEQVLDALGRAGVEPVVTPIEYTVGTDDRAIPAAAQQNQTLPLLPPGTPFELVPGAGHLLPYEAPGEVAAQRRLGHAVLRRQLRR